MGWTWQEYQAQPAWFIDMIHELLIAEMQAIKRTQDKVKYG
jgi:hypothetical protein